MKHMRRFTALVLALVMVFSLTVSASAATAQTVTVKLSPNITVTLDGEAQAMTDVKGNPVYPVLYGGTTYLPVRAVGNMLGLGVDWDQATQTVLLTTAASMEPATSGGKTPANAKPTDITVSINPNITVKLDGETQKMTNVNGDPVYPMLYGGTTYLPVRAVSNMLMVDVDWEQTTQTVILDNSLGTLTVDDNGDAIVEGSSYEQLYRTMKHFNVPQETIDLNLTDSIKEWSDSAKKNNVTRTISLNLGSQANIQTLKTLGEDHVGYDWVELDYSTASKGYIRVKVNERAANGVNIMGPGLWIRYTPSGEWENIPLVYSGDNCIITISQAFSSKEYKLSENERHKLLRPQLKVTFPVKISDPDAVWLLSHVCADYENSPNAVAKAKELTKNCSTEAEKITAIYNFVSKALTYDHALLDAENARAEAGQYNVDAERDRNPDRILASGKGVCEHYAILMTAMLRSIGVPCKYVSGEANLDGEWVGHGWVVVKPETGTLNIPGMGKDYAHYEPDDNNVKVPTDPTGWIRLDPTNANIPDRTSNDNNYHTDRYR